MAHRAQRRILIVADNARRDFVATRLLQRGFQARGADARLSTLWDMALNLRRFKPHAVMSNRANMEFARPASQCCRIYVFPAEGGHLTTETMLTVFLGRSYYKLDSVSWVRRCYLWSDYVRTALLATGMFRHEQLVVSGSARLDVYRHHVRTRPVPQHPEDAVLGVAFSAKSTSSYQGSAVHYAENYFDFHPDESFPVTPPGRNFEDVCWRDHAILRHSMRAIRQFLETQPGKVVLRPSPFENEEEFRFLERRYPGRVEVVVNVPMRDFLDRIDALLTCWSTTGLEALIAGVSVISIAGTIDQEHLFAHVNRIASGFEKFVPFYHLPSDDASMLACMTRALAGTLPVSPKSHEDIARLLHDLYTWPYERAAHAVIVDDVLRDLEDAQEVSTEMWREHFPIPHGVPFALAPALYWARSLRAFYRSGAFRTMRDFYRLRDRSIDNLLNRVTREAEGGTSVRTFSWDA